MPSRPPSRALLVAAGALTQVTGAGCFVLSLASVPVAVDRHAGVTGVLASAVAAAAAVVCGTLTWRGRLLPLGLAAGLDVAFGVALASERSAIGLVLHVLPADELQTAEALFTAAAIVMFAAGVLSVLAVPSALRLRRWARQELAGSDVLPQASAGWRAVADDDAAPTRERLRIDAGPSSLAAPSPSVAASRVVAEGEPVGAGGTLRGIGARLIPTQVIRVQPPGRRRNPAVVASVAVTLIALGVVVLGSIDASSPSDAPAPAAGRDATVGAPVAAPGSGTASLAEPPGPRAAELPDALVAAALDAAVDDVAGGKASLEDTVSRLHGALGTASAPDLAALLGVRVFAIGVDANDLAEGRDPVVAQVRDDLGAGGRVTVTFHHLGQAGELAWLAEELRVGDRSFVMTAVLGLQGGTWTVEALQLAQAMPNAAAFRLARAGELSVPDVIPDAGDTSPLASAMRTAFASRPSFVDARSVRADAFNFGSAPGERLEGGETVRRVFARLTAGIRLHDAVKVGVVGARGGWGVANVEFTEMGRDGAEVTQTFRVLAAWLQEDAGWRIVQTQWSNAR